MSENTHFFVHLFNSCSLSFTGIADLFFSLLYSGPELLFVLVLISLLAGLGGSRRLRGQGCGKGCGKDEGRDASRAEGMT